MLELPSLKIPDDFFAEEKRCGYRVDTKRKEIWAVELDLYKKLEMVCEKYGLMLYADSGTLLGAVRHQGFIPWDDDMDFVMFRDDYDKLCEVGEHEFKYPYYFQTDRNCLEYRHGHIQIRNSETTAVLISEKEKGYKHNQGIFIDIFPIDGLPDAPKRAEYWKELIELTELARECLNKYNVDEIIKSLNNLEECLRRYPPKEGKKAALLSYELNRKKGYRYLSDYSSAVRIPFEFTDIQAPFGYKNILRIIYGVWKKPMIVESDHKDVIFDVSRPYTDYLTMD